MFPGLSVAPRLRGGDASSTAGSYRVPSFISTASCLSIVSRGTGSRPVTSLKRFFEGTVSVLSPSARASATLLGTPVTNSIQRADR